MGIFVRKLGAYGFSPVQIVSIRITLAALFFCALLLAKDRSGFRIPLRDLPLFLGLGLGSILFFTVCYFTAIRMMPLSTAAILLYTSPIWIMLMSVLFFREKLNGRKFPGFPTAELPQQVCWPAWAPGSATACTASWERLPSGNIHLIRLRHTPFCLPPPDPGSSADRRTWPQSFRLLPIRFHCCSFVS